MRRLLYISVIVFLFCSISWSQNQDFSSIETALDNYELDKAEKILLQYDSSNFDNYDKAKHDFYFARIHAAKDNTENALKKFLSAKKLFVLENAEEDVLECNLALISLIENLDGIENQFESIKTEISDYIKKEKDPKAIYLINNRIASNYLDNDNSEMAIAYFNKNVALGDAYQKPRFKALSYANISTVHSILTRKQDSALYYNKNAIDFLKKDIKNNEIVAHLYNNRARIFQELKKYNEALKFYQKADSINLRQNVESSKRIYYANLAKLYQEMGNYKEALAYFKKEKTINDSINQTQQNIAVSEIQTKYETEKKQKENAFLKSDIEKKKQTQTILWIVVVASIIIGTGISILIAKNAKRKQQLARQEELLKIQLVEKELKEHELNSIDVLIDGQEKERQRLAENLHDNLGGTLAALKLNLQNLQHNKENKSIADKSVNNSLNLIEDAYQNVRQMAHEKNHGVVANQGLLPALKKLINNISSEKLMIEIKHFGLENRLENSLEIRIFRIIQELITNIIKHAQASKASIALTNHNTTLNIIVEDNGKGFSVNKTAKVRGMGLSTVEKRIENLGGTLEIDSYPNKGTSIIINLPLG
jgi:signal transduction histidine kinase